MPLLAVVSTENDQRRTEADCRLNLPTKKGATMLRQSRVEHL